MSFFKSFLCFQEEAGTKEEIPPSSPKTPVKDEVEDEDTSFHRPYQSGRRNAVSAEVVTDDDVKNYVKKVGFYVPSTISLSGAVHKYNNQHK